MIFRKVSKGTLLSSSSVADAETYLLHTQLNTYRVPASRLTGQSYGVRRLPRRAQVRRGGEGCCFGPFFGLLPTPDCELQDSRDCVISLFLMPNVSVPSDEELTLFGE